MSRVQTIVTVTPNPAVDLTYTVAGVQLGGSHRVPAPLSRAGGKGINVSRVLHQQGRPTTALATAGGATGAQLADGLAQARIPHRLIPVVAPTRRTVALVDSVAGQTSIFNESGAPLSASEWQALAAAVADSLEAGAGALVGSGSLPEGAPADFYPGLVALAHSLGVAALIDTSGPGLAAAARAGADVLKPNTDELLGTMGGADVLEAAGRLLGLGARFLLVSAGADGMLAFDAADPGSYLRARLPVPLTGNPTGAGDAAVAAAAVALSGLPPQGRHGGAGQPTGETFLRDLLATATAWSAAAVLMPGAGEISPDAARLQSELTITRHETKDRPWH